MRMKTQQCFLDQDLDASLEIQKKTIRCTMYSFRTTLSSL